MKEQLNTEVEIAGQFRHCEPRLCSSEAFTIVVTFWSRRSCFPHGILVHRIYAVYCILQRYSAVTIRVIQRLSGYHSQELNTNILRGKAIADQFCSSPMLIIIHASSSNCPSEWTRSHGHPERRHAAWSRQEWRSARRHTEWPTRNRRRLYHHSFPTL